MKGVWQAVECRVITAEPQQKGPRGEAMPREAMSRPGEMWLVALERALSSLHLQAFKKRVDAVAGDIGITGEVGAHFKEALVDVV